MSARPSVRVHGYADAVSSATTSQAPSEHLRVWVNGWLYGNQADAHVPALDHGLTVGDGVFEALKVTTAGPFALQRHLDRLTRSAAALDLPAPDHGLIRGAVEQVLEGRGFTDGKIRITYSGGLGPLGSQAAYGTPTLVVAADARTFTTTSAKIVTAPWVRNERGALAGVKSTSYGENVRALAYAHAQDAAEAIFVNTVGHVCEGTGSNLFCVFGDQVVTSPLSSGALAGITRALVLEWNDVTESDLGLAEALTADEVFLTSSMRDVQAVHQWDALEFDDVGPVTRRVADDFARRSTANLEP